MSDESDPYREFKVEPPSCLIFSVKIVKGYNITKGYNLWHTLFRISDPYVKLTIKKAPNGTQRTKHFNNDVNPEWNETFKFFLDPSDDNEMEISLVVPNFLSHETISTKTIKISKEPQERFHEKLQFSEESAVDIEISSKLSDNFNLKQRYSKALCDDEKHFIEERRKSVFQAMQDILGDDAPRTITEVPTIGVLGSGGGFRALTASSGVMGALVKSRISDMVIYNAGLSGSAWYLSTLYSHPDWPQKSPRELRNELRDSIGYSLFWKLNPFGLWRYRKRVNAKCDQGQPVSLTDYYGLFIGETLLQGRLDTRLTDQREKLREGKIPLPMYAAVRVKTNVSAKVFHEWMEFTPYEIGILKYGIYIPAEMFGSKFFMGHLVKNCEEPRLHFLQGIWGSAYCVLLKRFFWKKDKKNSMQERDELDKELSNESLVQDSSSSDTRNSKGDGSHNSATADSYENVQKCSEVKLTSHDAYAGHEKKKKETNESMGAPIFSSLGSLVNYIPLWHTFEKRAAVVYNFMRGLSVQTEQESKEIPYRFLLAPQFGGIEESTEDRNKEIFEKVSTSSKKLYAVDAGLAFNSPYPLLLRHQRGVDLVLSFEYSSRDQDEKLLFSELLLAKEWAKLNKVPFPDIDPKIADREGLKECYVFENPDDPKCPIVMHFVILNVKFREYKAPGVPRRTKEEKDYGNFDIFDDPNGSYSTSNFKYTNQAFDRLADLMEFNTLLWKEEIIENIKKCVKKRAN